VDLLGKILALTCAILWAVAVILFKRAGDSIRPLSLNWYKTALTALVMLPFLFIQGLGGLSRADVWAVLASGVIGIAVSDTLFFIALDRLGASLAAIVDCCYAPFVMIAAWIMLSQEPRLIQIGGGLFVIAAVLVVAFDQGHAHIAADRRRLIVGFLAGAGAMAFMGVSIALMQPILTRSSLWVVTELRVLAALAVLTPMMLLHSDRRELFTSLVGSGAWRHALPGAFLGNVLAMTIWVAAFKYTSVNSAAILNQTSTIFIVLLATWMLKETFTRRRLIGTLLAFSGAVMVIVG
jgi:drug/metabolite transporter (DMT)-like permease